MICIAGKNEIAIYGIKLLINKGFKKKDITVLINKNDTEKHEWQPSFKKYCKDNDIEESKLENLYKIHNLIFISLEYDRIIKTDLFKSKNLFNIHFSLLPAYKGMFTSIYPILRGEKSSGVTLHKIDNGIDTGDIIDQIEFEMPFGITGLKLYKLYLKYSKELLYNNIDKIISLQFNSTQQALIGASYFSNKSIDFKSINIDFNKTSFEICNYVNAFSFRPYQLVSFGNVRISKALAINVKSKNKPGNLILENDLYFEIATVDYNVKLLKDKLKDILECSSKNDLKSVKEYYNLNFDLDEKNDTGWNALIVASFNGAFDIVKFIIENKISNVNDVNNNGTSVLMYAMTNARETNDLRIMEYLIKKGANHKLTDYKGLDILHYAKEYRNKKVINYLSKIK